MLGAPNPVSLPGPMPSRPILRLKLLGRFWGGKACLTFLKPHPVCAESSRLCRAPGGLGIPERLSLYVSLRQGLTVALR